jgi:hypothetical protein
MDLADCTVADHLSARGLDYTLSVFLSERGCGAGRLKREALEDALGMTGLSQQ